MFIYLFQFLIFFFFLVLGDLIGKDVRTGLRRVLRYETKSDKFESRLLVCTRFNRNTEMFHFVFISWFHELVPPRLQSLYHFTQQTQQTQQDRCLLSFSGHKTFRKSFQISSKVFKLLCHILILVLVIFVFSLYF